MLESENVFIHSLHLPFVLSDSSACNQSLNSSLPNQSLLNLEVILMSLAFSSHTEINSVVGTKVGLRALE